VSGEIIPTVRADPDPDVASIPRRAVSGTLDGVLLVLGWGGGVAAVVWRRNSGELSPPDMRAVTALGWAMRGAALLLRNRRSPGQRLLGIRRVDARTGGPVSLGAAIVCQLCDYGLKLLWRPVTRRVSDRQAERSAEATRGIVDFRAAHAGDTARIQEETMAIYRETGTSCVPSLLTHIVAGWAMPLTALGSPRRQTIADRVSGTVLVKQSRR
jgi:uncharacterized RDD family membrane protein YckC